MLRSSMPRQTMRIIVYIAISSLIVISLCGFQDIRQQGGADCKFQARIIDIEKPSTATKMLVVKEIPVKMKNADIYVFVTDDTFIGFPHKTMKFNDLNIGMGIEIQGSKIIEKQDGREIVDVYARSIRPIVE